MTGHACKSLWDMRWGCIVTGSCLCSCFSPFTWDQTLSHRHVDHCLSPQQTLPKKSLSDLTVPDQAGQWQTSFLPVAMRKGGLGEGMEELLPKGCTTCGPGGLGCPFSTRSTRNCQAAGPRSSRCCLRFLQGKKCHPNFQVVSKSFASSGQDGSPRESAWSLSERFQEGSKHRCERKIIAWPRLRSFVDLILLILEDWFNKY